MRLQRMQTIYAGHIIWLDALFSMLFSRMLGSLHSMILIELFEFRKRFFAFLQI